MPSASEQLEQELERRMNEKYGAQERAQRQSDTDQKVRDMKGGMVPDVKRPFDASTSYRDRLKAITEDLNKKENQ